MQHPKHQRDFETVKHRIKHGKKPYNDDEDWVRGPHRSG
jgi:hypothetical protein